MTEPNKWALLIGINEYLNAPSIRASVNDARLVADILRSRFGFVPERTRLLLDADATRARILGSIDWLSREVLPGDIVVVYFSGQAGQWPAATGPSGDELVSFIVPHDFQTRPDLITHKDLSELLVPLASETSHLAIVLDTAHAGALATHLEGDARWQGRYVFLGACRAEEVAYEWNFEGVWHSLFTYVLGQALAKASPDSSYRTIFEQVSSQVTARIQNQHPQMEGVGDWLLFATGKVASAGFVSIIGRSGDKVKLSAGAAYGMTPGSRLVVYPRQVRQVSENTPTLGLVEIESVGATTSDARIVSEEWVGAITAGTNALLADMAAIEEAMRFVSVKERLRYEVSVAAGAAHGLTVGSTWAVYSQDTRNVTANTPKLGLVEISEVGAVESKAKILSEVAAKAIAPGTKMIEETHNFGEMRLLVDVEVASDDLERHGERLRKMFFESELVRSADPGEQADVTAWLLPPRAAAEKDDPVPQLGALEQATWALVVGRDRLLGPTLPIEDRSAVWELRDRLEKRARFLNVLNLRNPNVNNPLVGKVDFRLEKQADDGSWVEPQPLTHSGMVALEAGNQIRFAIANHCEIPIYVSVLDFDLNGSIHLIYPPWGYASERLGPGEFVETGALVLSTPKEGRSMAGPEGEPADAGVETAKLFATTYETDFRALIQQDGMRGLKSSMGEATMLWELLDMALTGYGSRRSQPVQLPLEQEWITLEISFALSRKEGRPR